MFRAAGPPTQQSNTIECFSLIVSFKSSAPYQLIFAKILVLQGFLCACKRLLIRFSNLWCWQEGFSIHPIQTFFQIGSKNPEGGSNKIRKIIFLLWCYHTYIVPKTIWRSILTIKFKSFSFCKFEQYVTF